MTSLATHLVCGNSAIASMVSSDKGNIKNRAKCAGAQIGNNFSTAAQSAAVGLGAIGAAKYVAKSPARIDKLAKVFDKVLSKLPKSKLTSVQKFVNKLANSSGKAKAAAIIALPAIALLNYIGIKHIYKMGQIDQKYTDKAQMNA